MFKIFPAIDIKNGKCVRLSQGNFSKIKVYNEDPYLQAQKFYNLGYKNLHVIDLDGANTGDLQNIEIIRKIIKKNNFNIQVGGGIRTLDSLSKYIDIGVEKVILGTIAFKNFNFLVDACRKFKDKIALSIDARKRKVALSGWKEQTETDSIDYLNRINNTGVSRVIYTDIERDGMQSGPNFTEIFEVAQKTEIPFIVSGGVTTVKDIEVIKSKKINNIEGVIIGKALYEGTIDLEDVKKYEQN